jgi:cytosine/adenosine deaminase-related metal-dependent hydrolase
VAQLSSCAKAGKLEKLFTMPSILFKNATIVTMNPRREIIRGDLLVRDDRIAAIGKLVEHSLRDTSVDRTIDASDWTILPGFVQTHVHLCQTLFRNQAEDMELLDWLQKKIWPLEAAHDENSMRLSARLGIAELLAGGTTTILDMGSVHHYDAIFDELEKSGMRAAGGKCMMDAGDNFPAGLRETTHDSLRISRDLMERWHGAANGRLRYAFAPRFALSCSEKLLREVAEISAAKGCMMHTHSSENHNETKLVQQRTGKRNVEYLSSLGICGHRACLAHCIQIDENEIAMMAREHTRVAHCPGSNLKLASGIAPVVKMRKAGVVVGLGADGAPCNNNLDMLNEMRLAALLQKISAGVGALSAQATVEMATIDGARCLGWEDEIGSLEVGKKADVVAINLSQPHLLPASDIYTQLVYASRASDVAMTMVDGKILFEKGDVKSVDVETLRHEAQEEVLRLAERAGI